MAKKSHNQVVRAAMLRNSPELPRYLKERDLAYINTIHGLANDAIQALDRGQYLYAAKSLRAACGELAKMADALMDLHQGT